MFTLPDLLIRVYFLPLNQTQHHTENLERQKRGTHVNILENGINKIKSYKIVTYRNSFIPEERSIKESIEAWHLKNYITVPYSDPEYRMIHVNMYGFDTKKAIEKKCKHIILNKMKYNKQKYFRSNQPCNRMETL